MHKIWDTYPLIKNELEEIVQIIDQNARCRDKKIESSIKELLYSNGKLIRPAFTVIAAHFGEYHAQNTRALAAVVEMFHMATLVHDDVIDDAKLRRGQETVQYKYGKEYAVYIGDYLFCMCFKVLAETASLQTIQMDSRSMSRICMGEVEQLSSRFNPEVSVKHYLKRISGKTAELFALSLFIGAAESGCDKKICRTFWNIGHYIGMAFQIIDDLLDYEGDEGIVGKDHANDLKDGIYTLPLIYALEQRPHIMRPLIEKESYTEENIKEIIRMTKELGGTKEAKKLAVKYSEKAFRRIGSLPENPYKEVLREITKLLLNRIA